LVKTQGNVNSLRAIYDGMKAKAAALEYTKAFFVGSNSDDPNSFDGLKPRLTGDQVIDMGSSSGGDTLTLDALDELLDQVVGGADALFMNKTLRRKVNALMRSAGQAMEQISDSFGRQIGSYAGVPIGVVEEDKDGDQILAFDEDNPGGGTAASSSIYAVRFGAGEYVSGIQSGDLDVIDQGLVNTHYQTLVEWLTGLACFHPKAAARLRGIKNA
jgi:hypothetical protein